MTDDQLTRLLSYLQGEFADIRKQIETTDNRLSERLDTLYNYIDEDMGRRDTEETERLAMADQLTKHDEQLDDHDSRLGHLEQKAA